MQHFHAGNLHQIKDAPPNTWATVRATDVVTISELARRGWTSRTFKPGDKVKMTGHAAKDGSKVLFLTKVETADGKAI